MSLSQMKWFYNKNVKYFPAFRGVIPVCCMLVDARNFNGYFRKRQNKEP